MNLVDPHDHDIHRFEDDGAPAPPPRIGIAPETVVLKDARPEKPRHRDRRLILPGETESVGISRKEDRDSAPASKLVLVISDAEGGRPVIEGVGPPLLLDARGEEVSSLTWPSFLAWRKTKCETRDIEPGFVGYEHMKENFPVELEAHMKAERLEEIDQATHELVGEVAELGELFLANGPAAFFGEQRAKLIDEIGDIFFCAAWALDAWGSNPLAGTDDLELLRVRGDSDLARMARVLVSGEDLSGDAATEFFTALGLIVLQAMLAAQTCAGLTSNSFKKLKYQRRAQDVEQQVSRIVNVLFVVNQVLIIANSSVEEALRSNMRKLDARYPDGYVAGQGGGIRQGDGR